MNLQPRYGKAVLQLVWFGALAGAFFILPARAQDAAATWQALAQPVFDPSQAATAENITLVRDRIRITLLNGTIQFSQRAPSPRAEKGIVFGAAFQGRGRLEIQPPNPLETQQLHLFTGQSSLNMEFTEATFTFTDKTYDEVASQVRWSPSSDKRLEQLYADRQKHREDVGAELLPRLFKAVLSSDGERTALFAADLKTGEKGWIHTRFDALEPEEILTGRWQDSAGGFKQFDTWLSFPAGARAASEVFRDPLAKEDFWFKSYRIDATVTAGAELTATTRATIEHRVADERVLQFLLDANLRIESVKDAQGQALVFFQPRDPKDRNQSYGDYVTVVLPAPTQRGQAQTIEFRYGGKRVVRQVGSGGYFCQSYGWYPTRPSSSFAARVDFEMNFKSPKKYTLVATGNRVSETTDGDWDISTWRSDLPLAVAGFAFGDYKVQTEKAGAIDIEVYANREADDSMAAIRQIFDSSGPGQQNAPLAAVGNLSPAAMAKTMSVELANTIRVFEAYFGPYPYKRLALTNIPYSYGQGWPTLIYLSALSFLDSTQRNALGIRAHLEITDFFRAHESSHQWWGHRVGWKSYHDQWLSEGFAQFSGNLYIQVRQGEKGDKEYLNRIREDRRDLLTKDERGRVYEQMGPVWMGQRLLLADSPRAYQTVIYNKGGLILHMLRRLMVNPRATNPEEQFMAMMKDFCATFHNLPASTEDFKAIAEKHMTTSMDLDGNRKLDWFFRQYVYGTGVPQYALSYSARDAGGGKWTLSGTVIQGGVPDGWKDALPLYVQHSGGKLARLGVVTIRERETTFTIDLPVKPEKVALNLFEDTIAEIKQP